MRIIFIDGPWDGKEYLMGDNDSEFFHVLAHNNPMMIKNAIAKDPASVVEIEKVTYKLEPTNIPGYELQAVL